MHDERLSLEEARRIALAAQGFDRPRPARVRIEDLRRTIRELRLVQIDCVNVLVPAHYQVLYSRLGPYDRAKFDDLVYRRREFTEQWAHEASIVPVETWPLLGYRREENRVHPHGYDVFPKKHAAYSEWVIEQIRTRGPLPPAELPAPDGVDRRIPGSWVGTVPRAVLEAHFGSGRLAVADRLSNFSRVFELAERVIPAEHYGRQVEHTEARRQLLLQAAQAHGVGTAADLADYFRMQVRDARPHLDAMAADGELLYVHVEGWREPAYLDPQARTPKAVSAAALLSPFDPVVWFRPRLRRLFDFDHRFEIFVPVAQRKWGPYVLPFLMGERIVARVDLKADRTAGRIVAPAAFLEPHADADGVAAALACELQTMARWLGLKGVAVGRRGGFARKLAAAVKRASG